MDQMGIFQHRDKDGGRDHAVFRIHPACKRFVTAILPGECAHLPLIISLDIALLQSLREAGHDVLMKGFFFGKLLIVNTDVLIKDFLCMRAGDLGVIRGKGRIDFSPVTEIDTSL